MDDVTKYGLSHTRDKADWKNSIFLRSVDNIRKLKQSAGSDLQVHGSGHLVQTLLMLIWSVNCGC